MAKRSAAALLDFLTPLSEIPGMGPKRFDAFKQSEIEKIGDLLYYFPRSYIDRSIVEPIGSIDKYLEKNCTVCATVKRVRFEPGRKSRLRALVADDTGELEILWFQGAHLYQKKLKTGDKYLITGKITRYGHFQMVHPHLEAAEEQSDVAPIKFIPQYSITTSMREAGIQQGTIRKMLKWVLDNLSHYPCALPQRIVSKKSFSPLSQCLKEIHFPNDLSKLDLYKKRIKYEELYKTAVILKFSRKKYSLPGRSMDGGGLVFKFEKQLPFSLTDDQKKAIKELLSDAKSPKRMHRLLQGDVGSGKTLVAFFSCLPALNENYQVAWLVPTEVLARQAYTLLSNYLSKIGFRAALLTGGMNTDEKKETLTGLASGELKFIIGTHALIQKNIQFKALGMVVIDEQHKFGVQQRSVLLDKDPKCDFLLMSATPIPQSLAMTLYGDLDIVTISKCPPGRVPVSTHIVPEVKRADMERFIAQQLQNSNSQAFYVVSRIENEEAEQSNLKDIVSVFNKLTSGFFASIPSEFIHGRLTGEQKEKVMNDFAAQKIKLLVSTSVIEVGIDIPQASIIVIENAELFGLAQLHQLRGRVGRGGGKSFCFLLVSENTEQSVVNRLNQFCKNHDGFKVAELDLHNRGPGEMTGIRQSGWGDLKMVDIINDIEIFKEIQDELKNLVSS